MMAQKRAKTLIASTMLFSITQTWIACYAPLAGDAGYYDTHPAGSGIKNGADPELVERVRRLEGGISLLQCGPPLKALMANARKMCTTGGPDPSGKKCDEKRLKLPIANARQELGVMQIGDYLLTTLRHEAVYLKNGTDISDQRKERLRQFASEARQSTTRYLIISGAEDGAQRAEVVQRTFTAMLRNAEAGHDSALPSVETIFDKPWLMPLPRSKLLGVDKPLPPGEPNEPGKAVFVIRTDCQSN
jgi:hypothetical protein